MRDIHRLYTTTIDHIVFFAIKILNRSTKSNVSYFRMLTEFVLIFFNKPDVCKTLRLYLSKYDEG